jgi:septal ring factor EnvC (AmiA/AmiB activator)
MGSEAANGNRRRLISVLAGPMLTIAAGLSAGAVGVWAQSQVTASRLGDHERRIETLEQSGRQSGGDAAQMKSDIAVLKERVDTIKEDTSEIRRKLDALIEQGRTGRALRGP